MASTSFELRELFHITLLRQLGTRLSGRSYSVKGGICLRFFHRSPRLSEDMDLDIASNVRVETLENAVDSVINGRAMIASLIPSGVTRLSASAPKQTATTQRWKVALILAGGAELRTKVEFSRRKGSLEHSTGVPDAELLRYYKMSPFAAQYYGSDSMAAQKIIALAAPQRNALRDLFDLHHLLFVIKVDQMKIRDSLDSDTIEKAADKIGRFDFKDFQEQVAPYLTTDLIDLYKNSAVFDQQKAEVERTLVEMLQ